jgi:hypothetical protein
VLRMLRSTERHEPKALALQSRSLNYPTKTTAEMRVRGRAMGLWPGSGAAQQERKRR